VDDGLKPITILVVMGFFISHFGQEGKMKILISILIAVILMAAQPVKAFEP